MKRKKFQFMGEAYSATPEAYERLVEKDSSEDLAHEPGVRKLAEKPPVKSSVYPRLW